MTGTFAQLSLVLGVAVGAESVNACDWAYEVFSTKVSDNCQQDLLAKLPEEQDKIFTRRMFGAWEPLGGAELTVDGELIQYIDDEDDESFQMVWLSHEPAVAVINGVAVVDDSKDPSVYRQVERMIKKADELGVALNRPTRSPIELFLFSNEAWAKANSRRQYVPFIFTVEGRSGTASEYFDKDQKNGDTAGGFLPGSLKGKGILPNKTLGPLASNLDLTCKGGGLLEPHPEVIDGRPVTIHETARGEFIIKGYPSASSSLRVSMGGESGGRAFGKKVVITDKRGKPVYRVDKHGHRHLQYRWGIPCNETFKGVDNYNQQCLTAWADLAKQEEFKELSGLTQINSGDADEVKGALNNGTKRRRCGDFFPGKDKEQRKKREDCFNYFRNLVPSGSRHITLGSATIKVCEGNDTARCKVKSDRELGQLNPEISESEKSKHAGDTKIAFKRMIYRDALMRDLLKEEEIKFPHSSKELDPRKLPKDKKGRISKKAEAARDEKIAENAAAIPDEVKDRLKSEIEAVCPTVPSSILDWGKVPECKAPPKGASAATVRAFKALERKADEAPGRSVREKIERRLLGEMMMGDCCESPKGLDGSSCMDKLKKKYGIELKGGAKDRTSN